MKFFTDTQLTDDGLDKRSNDLNSCYLSESISFKSYDFNIKLDESKIEEEIYKKVIIEV